MTASFIKDPSARKDYTVDWTAWLDDDTIDAVEWMVPSGITQTSASNTTTAATVWLSGGTHGSEYAVVCQITTAGGRIDQRSIPIRIREQ